MINFNCYSLLILFSFRRFINYIILWSLIINYITFDASGLSLLYLVAFLFSASLFDGLINKRNSFLWFMDTIHFMAWLNFVKFHEAVVTKDKKKRNNRREISFNRSGHKNKANNYWSRFWARVVRVHPLLCCVLCQLSVHNSTFNQILRKKLKIYASYALESLFGENRVATGTLALLLATSDVCVW